MTASLWKQSLIGSGILEKNLCCICLSPPVISLPILQEVCAEAPEIKSTLHYVLVKHDFVPHVTMFLDPRNEDLAFNFEELGQFSSIKVCKVQHLLPKYLTRYFVLQDFQGLFTSNLLHHIGALQEANIMKVADL